MSEELLILIAILLTSLISLIGAFVLFLKGGRLQKFLFFFVSISVGALLGDAFLHLIPEALSGASSGKNIFLNNAQSLLVLLGIIFFFCLEKVLHWHHHHTESADEDLEIHPVGPLVLFSDVLHNVIDGIVIAASFYISIPVGVATTLAVMLHEIPHEIGNISLLIHAGYSRIRAVVYNCISAVGAFLGAILVIFFAERAEGLVEALVPFAAGTFIYIAGSDMVPELHKDIGIKKTFIQLIGILLGVLMMFLLLFLD